MIRTFINAFIQSLWSELCRVKWIILVILAYIVLGLMYVQMVGNISIDNFALYLDKFTPIFWLFLPLLSSLWLLCSSIFHTPSDPNIHMRSQCTPTALARYVIGGLLFFLLVPFWSTFTQIKNQLSRDGFHYDKFLADIEYVLHGGVDVANWLVNVGHYPWLLQWAQFNYNVLWQMYHLVVVGFMLLHPKAQRLRTFYILFYVAGWIVFGNLLAGMFISAGPTYYREVTGDAVRFAAVDAWIAFGQTMPHSAHQFQEYLWTSYAQGLASLGSGISAFPSIHIFIVTCNALFIFHFLNRSWGVAAAIYGLFVLLSSAYLGWHYLIDGYIPILISTVCFYLCVHWLRYPSAAKFRHR